MSTPKQWVVTGTSMVVEADTEAEAVDRAQEMSGWHWEAREVTGEVWCDWEPVDATDHVHDEGVCCECGGDHCCESSRCPTNQPLEGEAGQ